MKPQLEEFMIFEDKNGEMGVIIKSDDNYHKWWKCYRESQGGQVFNENDSNYKKIIKLYKVEGWSDKYFKALKFMDNGDLCGYECVYDVTKVEPVNITINMTVNCSDDIDKFLDKLKEQLGSVSEAMSIKPINW